MNVLFLMDPLDSVIAEKDTSLALMLETYRRKHTVYFLPDGGITRKNGKLHFHVLEVIPQDNSEQPFIEHKSCRISENDVDIIFIRSDPPFDGQYLINTWLLDLLPKHIPVINNPGGIRKVNEKIWATQFTSVIPPTIVGRNREDLLAFLSEEKDIIAKPTDGYGGQSVFQVKMGDHNANVILETLTQNWNRDIIVQRYIPESINGDKRILLLDGEFLGAVLRLHAKDDHRNNFFSGGKPLAAELNKRDHEIIAILKPELKKLGLYFVGIDILGDYLVEVNVTSPTCLREIDTLHNVRLEENVIDLAEKLVDRCKSGDKISYEAKT